MAELLNIHAILPRSRVNGPGNRLVVFFQGCSRNCTGCFNPGTHSFAQSQRFFAEDILKAHYKEGIEGLTVSGGEPFMQAKGLLELLRLSKALGLTNIVYTGFLYEELQSDPVKAEALGFIDTLIDGPFDLDRKETSLLARGSENQRIIPLTGRYRHQDFYMPGRVEVIISPGGVITETGFGGITLRECV